MSSKTFDNSRCNQGVIIPITNVIECPQGLVTVLVRPEPTQTRPDLWRHRGTAIQLSGEVGLLLRHRYDFRKTASPRFGVNVSRTNRASVYGMVQRNPEIVDGIPDNDRDFPVGCRCQQAEFVNAVSGLRLCLNDDFVRMFRPEPGENGIQILDMMFCSINLQS